MLPRNAPRYIGGVDEYDISIYPESAVALFLHSKHVRCTNRCANRCAKGFKLPFFASEAGGVTTECNGYVAHRIPTFQSSILIDTLLKTKKTRKTSATTGPSRAHYNKSSTPSSFCSHYSPRACMGYTHCNSTNLSSNRCSLASCTSLALTDPSLDTGIGWGLCPSLRSCNDALWWTAALTKESQAVAMSTSRLSRTF